ncbi:hypothetical protein PM398_gp43 [Pseudomonas phage Epa40]|uniref:Uncharacterized protein n=1 Tax=Pseudomonas phage Epa40 TaxID=2719198 RepID=A0A6G9LM08_9CAUD|nr:hypothetical protein PM398_gp43 [Pseudomonas phage Epa40]QIQ66049.1 hypothetical protein 40_00043 [Pseudomonas phage Epa40]QIQ66101.1 hypothetical protein 41_00047 [Pseudomonas phage Epa41]
MANQKEIEYLKEAAKLLNNALRTFEMCDSVRADILNVAADGICTHCGEITNRCYCQNDE